MFSQVWFHVTEMNELSPDDIKGNAVKKILYLNVSLDNGIQTFTCILISIKNVILNILIVIVLPKTFLGYELSFCDCEILIKMSENIHRFRHFLKVGSHLLN